MFLLKIPAALVALFLISSVRGDTNVTIDDTDPQIVYQPQGVWSFQGNTALTQDRWNKTTHYTSELGATASLTFTGVHYVHYVGYGVKEMSPPALVPITLQPQHGSAIAVQSDSYRPEGAQAQIILFSSNRLDPNETYTITVTKTNATLGNGVNIDSFILTQPDSAATDSTSSSSTVADSENSNTSPNTSPNIGVIVGGVLGGIAIGTLIAFLICRWWFKRNRHKRETVGSDGLPLYTDEIPRPAHFSGPPAYPSKRSGFSPQVTMPEVIDHRSVSIPVSTTPVTQASTDLGQRPVKDRRMEVVQVHQALPYTSLIHGRTQDVGNGQLSSVASVPSPEGTEYMETMLPAYS